MCVPAAPMTVRTGHTCPSQHRTCGMLTQRDRATIQAQQQFETLDKEAARLQQELRTGLAAANAIVRSICRPPPPATALNRSLICQLPGRGLRAPNLPHRCMHKAVNLSAWPACRVRARRLQMPCRRQRRTTTTTLPASCASRCRLGHPNKKTRHPRLQCRWP